MSADLKSMTDADLQKLHNEAKGILEERERIRTAEKAKVDAERNAKVIELAKSEAGRELFLALLPDHGRSGCTDVSLNYEGRCNRCDMIRHVLTDEYIDDNARLLLKWEGQY